MEHQKKESHTLLRDDVAKIKGGSKVILRTGEKVVFLALDPESPIVTVMDSSDVLQTITCYMIEKVLV